MLEYIGFGDGLHVRCEVREEAGMTPGTLALVISRQ